MGNLFIMDSNEIHYYTCYKCNDSFKNHCGGYSERTSGRYHNIDTKTKTCTDCGENINVPHNCYHVKKKSLWWFN